MQPYFFPYIGYFELISRADRWVVFDVCQYKRKSWMNRNRILRPPNSNRSDTSWQYVHVPVEKAPREARIQDIRVKDIPSALDLILAQVEHYKKRAPYFHHVKAIVEDAFLKSRSNLLVDLNISALAAVCRYIGLPFEWELCSKMELELGGIVHPGQWALEISRQLGAEAYINPPGGRGIFRQEEWDLAGIDLKFTEFFSFRYNCDPYKFEDALSIIDVMMWNAPEEIFKAIFSKPSILGDL
nr:WbqC family protein [Desulfosarcina widdelii]